MLNPMLSPVLGGFRKGITNKQTNEGENFARCSHCQSEIEHHVNALPWLAGQGVAVLI